MAKLRSRILFVWHLVWFAVLLLSYQLQNESCRLVPEPLNRCLTFGGRYIFMTHLLQLSSKVGDETNQSMKLISDYLCLIYWVVFRSKANTSENTEYNVVTPDFTPFNCCMPNVPNFICHWPESGSKSTYRPGKIGFLETKLNFPFQYIPANLDFLIHVAIVPAMMIESALGAHKINIGATMKSMTCFMIGYSAWSIFTFYMTNKWPYG